MNGPDPVTMVLLVIGMLLVAGIAIGLVVGFVKTLNQPPLPPGESYPGETEDYLAK